jgi:hypothetical protein
MVATMRDLGPLRPRDPQEIRAAMAVHIAAHAFGLLPLGFWQRRIAARAFGLAMVPPLPRSTLQLHVRRLRGASPTLTLSTPVMTWGLSPWPWQGEPRMQVREARFLVRRVRAVTSVPSCGVVFLVPPSQAGTLHLAPRVRLGSADLVRVAVGIVTWADLASVLDDAVADLDEPTAALAARARTQLSALLGRDGPPGRPK